MKLDFIRISELAGDPPEQERIKKLATELACFDAIRGEVERAEEKKNISKRAESLAGLYLLSRSAELCGEFVKRTERGRPFTVGGSFDFSISHSGDLAVCAVGDKRIGIDVELLRTVPDRDKLAKRYFCNSELLYLNSAHDRDEAFFRIWTRKEAYLKFTGDGFFGTFGEVDTCSGLVFEEKIITVCEDRYIISVYEGK